MSDVYANIGAILCRKKNYGRALDYYNLINPKDSISIYTQSNIYNNKALCYFQQEKYDVAEFYHLKSIHLKKELNDTNGLAIAYLNLGDFYYDQYKNSGALKYWKKSNQLARKIKADPLLENVCFNLSLLYEDLGNYKQALFYYKNSDSARNRLTNKENIWEFSKIEKKLALQTKQLKITELEKNNYKKQIELNERSSQRNFFSVMAFGLFIVAGIIALFLRQKNKTSKIIYLQKTELENLNQTKDRLFSIVAHDLRSPINSLLNKNKQAVQFVDLGEHTQAKNIIYSIHKDIEQTSILLNNLLHWSFSETGNLFILPQPLLLKACVEQVVDELQFAIKEKNIVFDISIPDYLSLNTDLNSLKIILRNLFQNAIKFSYLNQKIKINCCQENDFVTICIRDYGIGIPINLRDKLFDMDNNKIRKGTNGECGSGLGLWLINYLLQKNSGSIFINRQLEQGTEITVQFNMI